MHEHIDDEQIHLLVRFLPLSIRVVCRCSKLNEAVGINFLYLATVDVRQHVIQF